MVCIYWEVVGGGEYILGSGGWCWLFFGWWWVVVDGDGWWWVKPQFIIALFCRQR